MACCIAPEALQGGRSKNIRIPGSQWGMSCASASALLPCTFCKHSLPMTDLREEPVQSAEKAAQLGPEAQLLVPARLLPAQGVHHTALQLRCVGLTLPAAASAR